MAYKKIKKLKKSVDILKERCYSNIAVADNDTNTKNLDN